MIYKSGVDVNITCFQYYKNLRELYHKKYKQELGRNETYRSRAFDIINLHYDIMEYHLAIFYSIGKQEFVNKCHSYPVIKIWHPLG